MPKKPKVVVQIVIDENGNYRDDKGILRDGDSDKRVDENYPGYMAPKKFLGEKDKQLTKEEELAKQRAEGKIASKKLRDEVREIQKKNPALAKRYGLLSPSPPPTPKTPKPKTPKPITLSLEKPDEENPYENNPYLPKKYQRPPSPKTPKTPKTPKEKKPKKEKVVYETGVEVPIVGETSIALPEWYAKQGKKGKWRLVNPLTHSRNLSSRGHQNTIRLIRKPVEDAVVMEHQTEPIPLHLFNVKDRKIINENFKVVKENRGVPIKEVPSIELRTGEERGRPEYLKKNVEVNRERGIKATATKRVRIAPPIKVGEEEGENGVGRKRGRKAIYKTEEEKRLARNAHNRKSYHRLKDLPEGVSAPNTPKGTGFNEFINKVIEPIKKVGKAVGDYANVVINGRNDYPPKVRQLLSKFGNDILASVELVRAPVPSLLTGALSAVSGGQFGKNLLDSPYDTLFHLRMDIETQNGNHFLIEKNEVINMDRNPKMPKNAESKAVQPISAISINVMLDNAKKIMGDKFFSYSARDNNCQDFILAILNANHFGDEADRSFVKQNTKELFANMPALRKFSNTITDIGAKVNEITTGKGLTDKVIKHLDKDNKEMIKLSKSLQKHLKTEKMTGGKLPQPPTDGDSSDSDSDDSGGLSGGKIFIGRNKISTNNMKEIHHHHYHTKEIDGEGVIHHHHHHHQSEVEMEGGRLSKIGSAFNKAFNPSKNGLAKALPTIENDAKVVGHYVIPATTSALGGAAGAALGGPLGGIVGSAGGAYAGQQIDRKLGIAGNTSFDGKGLRKAKFKKGSQEAKDYMASLRAKRGKGLYAGVGVGNGLYAGAGEGLYAANSRR